MTLLGLVAALVACVAVQAFFAASEIAVVSADEVKVRAESERGDSRSHALGALLASRDRLLALTLTSNNIATGSGRRHADRIPASRLSGLFVLGAIYTRADHARLRGIDSEDDRAWQPARLRALCLASAQDPCRDPRAGARRGNLAEPRDAPGGGCRAGRRERFHEPRRPCPAVASPRVRFFPAGPARRDPAVGAPDDQPDLPLLTRRRAQSDGAADARGRGALRCHAGGRDRGGAPGRLQPPAGVPRADHRYRRRGACLRSSRKRPISRGRSAK